MKACPTCWETNDDNATVCRLCKKQLPSDIKPEANTGTAVPAGSPSSAPEASTQSATKGNPALPESNAVDGDYEQGRLALYLGTAGILIGGVFMAVFHSTAILRVIGFVLFIGGVRFLVSAEKLLRSSKARKAKPLLYVFLMLLGLGIVGLLLAALK